MTNASKDPRDEALDDLLRRATAAPVPAGLVERVEARLARERHARRSVALARLSAAAALLAVVALAPWPRPVAVDVLPEVRPKVEVAAVTPPAPRVEVTFPPEADLIALPRPSENPSVTIIWLYPAVQTVQQAPPPTEEGSGT